MKKLALIFVALLGFTLLPAGVVGAREDDVIRRGGCSANSTWKLKLSPENGRTEVEFEVDQNRNGETWRVVLKRNGERFFAGARTTSAPSGSFELRQVVPQSSGDFVARARNLRTDEVCRGSASM